MGGPRSAEGAECGKAESIDGIEMEQEGIEERHQGPEGRRSIGR